MPSSSSFINVVVTAKGPHPGPSADPTLTPHRPHPDAGLKPASPSQQPHIPGPWPAPRLSTGTQQASRVMCPNKLLLPLFHPHIWLLSRFPHLTQFLRTRTKEAPGLLFLAQCLVQWRILPSLSRTYSKSRPPTPALRVTSVQAAASPGGLNGLRWAPALSHSPFSSAPHPPQPRVVLGS